MSVSTVSSAVTPSLYSQESQRSKVVSLFEKIAKFTRIFFEESLTTIRHILPSAAKWWYHTTIIQDIVSTELRLSAGATTHVAYLYFHGKDLPSEGSMGTSALFLHGDYGHPFTLLHLAKISQQLSIPTFSLYIPYVHNEAYLDIHSAFLQKSFQYIENFINQRHGSFRGILGIGHSKGSTLLAERHFCRLDSQLLNVFAVAGRVKIPSGDTSCPERLKPVIRAISRDVSLHPERPFVQVIPTNDWDAPREAMAIRPHQDCHIVPGMHLSGLYTEEVKSLFVEFLDHNLADTA